MDYNSSFLLWFLLACLTIHLLLSLLKTRDSNRRKLPPGPFPLPIFGNLFQLGSKPHKSLTHLAKIHGPLMTLQLGQLTTVVISSSTVAQQVLQKNDLAFSNRYIADASRALNHHEFSIALMPVSPTWRSQRKICNLQIFSISRLNASQNLRRKKVEDLLSNIRTSCQAGVAVDIFQATLTTILNLLSTALFSLDLLDPNSEIAREFNKLALVITLEAAKTNFADFFPVLTTIDPQRIRRRLTIHFKKLVDLFNKMIDQRLQAKNQGLAENKDVLDSLLDISQQNSGELEQSYIPHLLTVLFLAGTDTTSSTIEWAMAELLHSPDKWLKARAELEQVIGRGNPLEEGDIARLPYLQSVIKETLRLHPPLPFLLPRKVDTDFQLCGFTVPKSAQVLINAWAIGRDPNFWENPDSFEPERFLGSEIDFKGQHFELIPFGAGRRLCVGMPLALRMVPFILGSLLHYFDWKLENGVDPKSMDMDDEVGVALRIAQPLRAIPVHQESTS
ncbi:hypothetical protein Ancab_040197 [Ancistrocladus abbreviatus]